MITLTLTPIFASIFTLFYLFLSFRIGYLRGSPVVKLLFKMDKEILEHMEIFLNTLPFS